ncbi:MAG: RIP metalloprotease RseP [Pseudobdellovibrionaceae bacterium]
MDTILSYFHQGINAVIPFIILLGILIFVHELGHFLVARWCGIRVEVFSLGFGKKIFKYKKGDTTYALSLIPLGGYVKMFGEQPGETISEEDKKVSFTHKTVWQRIAVVAAGPLMNFFFAIFIFSIIALIGEDARKPQIGDVLSGSTAAEVGFVSGDIILSVNQTPVETWEDFQRHLNLDSVKDIPLNITVQREATSEKKDIQVKAQAIPNPNVLSSYAFIGEVDGILPYSAGTTLGISSQSPLYALGVRTGDIITSVNAKPVKYWRQLEAALLAANPKESLVLEIESPGEKNNDKKTLTLAGQNNWSKYSLDTLQIENSELYLNKVVDNSPAAKIGLKSGDRIVKIDQVQIQRWDQILNKIKSYSGSGSIQLEVLRDGQNLRFDINPEITKQMNGQGGEEKRFTIGIIPFINIANFEYMKVYYSNPLKVLSRGVEKTWNITVMTLISFVRLFENKISPKNIGGVISIGQAASETFKVGLSQFLQMMAIISVNLFILNLLPIPVLDGGHLLFYIIEAIKGTPVSLRKMEFAQQIGLALLMGLMVFALFNDFNRLLNP